MPDSETKTRLVIKGVQKHRQPFYLTSTTTSVTERTRPGFGVCKARKTTWALPVGLSINLMIVSMLLKGYHLYLSQSR
jgi:hypothetical protein